jgi:hypothetical protein
MVAIMAWSTVMEYPCHKLPHICSVFRSLSLGGNKSNTTGATGGIGTVYPQFLAVFVFVCSDL